MFGRALALIALLLGPAVAAYAAGHAVAAHYLALGAVLAFNLGLLARPLASFAILVPVVYAAAAVTAQLSDGVAALIVAVAAAVGAASSQGFHRGLLALLAAALIGSFEPATTTEVMSRSLAMLAGCTYGFLLVVTVARGIEVPRRAVHPQTALSYAVLLAVLVLIAWITARVANFGYGWWLPLAVSAIGEPSLEGSVNRAVTRAAAALLATVPLLAVIDSVTDPPSRAAIALAFTLALLTAGRRRVWLQSFLVTPIIVLFAGQQQVFHDGTQYVRETLLICVVVFAFTVLSKWALWTLRPDAGRATA